MRVVIGIVCGVIVGAVGAAIAAYNFPPATISNISAPAINLSQPLNTISQVTANITGSPLPCSNQNSSVSYLTCKKTSGNLYAWQVTSGGVGGWFVIADTATVPTSGALIPNVDHCIYLPPNTSYSDNFAGYPHTINNGLTLLFTVGGCYTFIPSQTAFLSADFK